MRDCDGVKESDASFDAEDILDCMSSEEEQQDQPKQPECELPEIDAMPVPEEAAEEVKEPVEEAACENAQDEEA